MNRLQKKCMIASTGFHLLLVLLLLIGPGFLASKSEVDQVPLIDFVPVQTVEGVASGGGDPKAPPTAALSVTKPIPPTPIKAPDPVPEPIKPEPKSVKQEPKNQNDAPSFEVSSKPQPRKIEISTKVVKRDLSSTKNALKAQAEAEAKEASEVQRRLVDNIGRNIEGIRGGLSGSTSIKLRGPGSGGEPYAGFDQSVLSIYDRAWNSPEGMTSDEAVVGVRVVINQDGTVDSARIIQRSGDPAVDRSVQETLDRVRYIAPFPKDSKQKQRTIEFNFRPRAKRLIG